MPTPKIDIFRPGKDKANPTNQVVSQNAQFTSFMRHYMYLNDEPLPLPPTV
jgi:hypothetical protein